MSIFVLTDNRFWLENAVRIFSKNTLNVDFFCSPGGSTLFENEIQDGTVRVADLKSDISFLLDEYSLGFSCHCKQIFPKELVEKVRCINIHPGLNPYNRGWFPQVFSILNKYPVGATIHLMDDKIDHGDILYQKKVDVFEWDTSKSVYDRVLNAEVEIFEEHLFDIVYERYKPEEMKNIGNYNSIGDYKELLEIDMSKSLTVREVIDYLRAMSHQPYDNAYFLTEDGEKVYVSINLKKD